MSKIKKVIALADLPVRFISELDDWLNFLFYAYDHGCSLDDLERFLTQKTFALAFTKVFCSCVHKRL